MTQQENNTPKQSEDINTKPESADNIDEMNSVSQDDAQSLDLETALQEKNSQIKNLEDALQVAKKNESEAMIRARAEIDNIRRRVEQDIEKAHKFALEKFSLELLPVIDNLERAIETTDKENPEYKATVEGLELTLKSFLDTVKKFGIEAVSTDIDVLNPDVHQAISVVESSDHASGAVVQTIQKGYTLNNRLIRPAMVIVAK